MVSQAWRGLPPRLVWSAPLAAATFTYYQVLKSETTGARDGDGSDGGGSGDAGGGSSSATATTANFSLKTVLGGPAVLALSVGLRTPFDILEQSAQLTDVTRQQQQPQPPQAPSTSSAPAPPSSKRVPFTPTPAAIRERLLTTWRAEGAQGVWRGYPAAFFGIFSYIAGYFVIYEGARRALDSRAILADHPSATHLLAGGLGGGLTSVLATPFDVVKVRMQTKIYATEANPFPSMLHVLRATVRDAGWQGLWRGAVARGTSNAPSGAIMFAVYEAGHRFLDAKLMAARRRAER